MLLFGPKGVKGHFWEAHLGRMDPRSAHARSWEPGAVQKGSKRGLF